MSLSEDLVVIARQEAELHLPRLDFDIAWRLGLISRELAVARNHPVVIDIRRFGQPHQPLFYTALSGTSPDNARWVERKSNVVARFHRSSYAVGLSLQQSGRTFSEKYSLPDSDYAAHGGSFPLHIVGVGVLGSITVSGLPQRDDHNLVVESLCLELNRDLVSLQPPTPS